MILLETLVDIVFTISEYVGLFFLSFSSPNGDEGKTAPAGEAPSR